MDICERCQIEGLDDCENCIHGNPCLGCVHDVAHDCTGQCYEEEIPCCQK